MNSIIKQQLKNVTSVNIEFDDNTTEILIPKVDKILNSTIQKDKTYVIRLFPVVTNPHENSALASNWNKGRIPKHEIYEVELVEKLGNMMRFTGIPLINGEESYDENFYYWLPDDSFEVISLL